MKNNPVTYLLRQYMRNGALFRKLSEELAGTQVLCAEELAEYQDNKLRQTIKDAYENVPYYGRLFKKMSLVPDDIRTKADLEKLPVMDKQTVRENFADLRNRNFKGPVFEGHTSGTTGSPAVFLRDLYSINFENAVLWRFYGWAGKSSRTRRVTVRGESIAPAGKVTPPFWKHNMFSRELNMSSFHLSDGMMEHYVDEISRFRPYDLYAYPSSAYLLADYCRRKNRDLKFSAVFTSSEKVEDEQRKVIEETFGSGLFDWYGSAERVAAIGQCEHGTYHEISDYSVTEYLPGEDGRQNVIGTTIHNTVMPLIRYSTGDQVKMSPETGACACGRAFPIIDELYGRQIEYLITPEGTKIGSVTHMMKPIPSIIETQFIQRKPDEIIVKLRVTEDFSVKDREKFLVLLKEYVSPSMDYRIEKVPVLDRSRSGKFKVVIQEMEI